MFRRKDELDMDGETGDMQGSLLSEESDNTVSVLSPQKAAEYQATKESNKSDTVKPVSAASAGTAAASTGASFSSPSTFGQTATKPAEPVKRPSAPTPPVAMPSQATAPANPVASNSNSNRPSHEGNRFRTTQEAPRSAPTAPTPSSTFNHSESNTMINKQQNPNERVLTVGNDILLKGEITTCDRLVIEGKVDATVSEVHTMELAAAGSFHGNAEVEYAEISGVFEGNLTVRTSLVIHQSGKVNGNISYGEVEIARGGTLTGEIKSIGASAQQQSISKKKEKAAA